MAYKLKKNTANRKNYGSKRAVSSIKYIVIHFTANDGDTDENNGKYFKNNVVKASAHYFVDSDSVTQSVPDNYTAYSVGGSKYSSCKLTGGGTLYGKCTNTNSISIELCDDKKNGTIYPSAKTIENAIALTKDLMKKYNIPASRVIRHFDVTGKLCPSYWCGTYSKDSKWKSAFWNKLAEAKIEITLAGAIKDERGKYKGGKPGDQLQTSSTNDTKGEVRLRPYYNHTKGWLGFRPKSAAVAKKLIEAMRQAVHNKFIGYDQDDRYDIMDMLKKYGSLDKIAEPTSCVCSSLLRACIYQATGIDLGPFMTGDIPKLFEKSGIFEEAFEVKKESDLMDGDIVCTKTEGHCEMAVAGNPRKDKASTFKDYKVKITTKTLNVRAGAGTSYKVKTTVKKDEVYTIVEEKKNGSTTWGKLKSGAGWISLQYTKKA